MEGIHVVVAFYGLRANCRLRFFDRLAEDVTIVEVPTQRKVVLDIRVEMGIFGEVAEDPFDLLWRFLILFVLVVVVGLLLVSFVLSLLPLESKILLPIFYLVDGLFSVFLFELINIVQNLYEPVEILLLV